MKSMTVRQISQRFNIDLNRIHAIKKLFDAQTKGGQPAESESYKTKMETILPIKRLSLIVDQEHLLPGAN